MKMIVSFVITGLRSIVGKVFGKVFDFTRGEDGKFKLIPPSMVKIVGKAFVILVSCVVAVIKLVGGDKPTDRYFENYKKELTDSAGVSPRKRGVLFQTQDLFRGDGLRAPLVPSPDSDPNATSGSNSKTADGRPAGGLDPNSASDCNDLLTKTKGAVRLTPDEQKAFDSCLTNNVLALTDEEKELYRKLADSSLSPEERALITKKLDGSISPEEEKILQALNSPNLTKEEKAAMLAALKEKNFEVANAIAGKASGEPVDRDATKAIRGFIEKVASEGAAVNDPSKAADPQAAMAKLLQQVASDKDSLEVLKEEEALNQAAARGASGKFGRGKILSRSEMDKIKAALEKSESRQKLERELADKQKTLIVELSKMQTFVSRVTETLKKQELIKSGVFVGYDDLITQADCKKIKPISIKRKLTGSRPSVTTIKTADGKSLAKEQSDLIRLRRKQLFEFEKNKNKMLAKSDDDDGLGDNVNIAELLGDDKVKVDIGSLTVFSSRSMGGIDLSPDTRIPAVLETEILVTSKDKAKPIRIKIMVDVYNSAGSAIVIPKNTIVTADTGSFSVDTGIMDIATTSAIVAGKRIPIRMTVYSGDNTPGLRGEVHDTRGRFLAGAFITSFTSGALQAFSQYYTMPLTQSVTNFNGALMGSGFAGGAEIASKIAEQFVNELQGAPSIYYSPGRGAIPLVLVPE